MSLALVDLVIGRDHFDPQLVAKYWSWRLGGDASAILATVLGNVFAERTDGSIWFLDSWSGDLLPVCDSYEDFRAAVATDEGFVRNWFLPDLVETLLASDLERPPGHCFSPFVSPGRGGSLSAENFAVATLNVHLATMAAECRSIGDSGA
jgi:hypothetical protein